MIEIEYDLQLLELFLDTPSRRPSKIYCVRVRGKDMTGKPYTRIRLFASRVTCQTFIDAYDKYRGELPEIEVFEGAVTWAKKALS